MTPEAIGRAIQLILAPVVMFCACSVFVGGVLNHYTSVSNRIRALTRERLELLRDPNAILLAQERLDEIDAQLPDIVHRHRLIHHALLAAYVSIAFLISTMCVIAVTASITAEWVGTLVYCLFVLGVLAMLVGVVLITLEIRMSLRSIEFEAEHVRRLPVRVTANWSERTVNA